MTANLALNIGEDFYTKIWVRHGVNKASKNLTGATISGGIKIAYDNKEPLVEFTIENVDLIGGIFALRIPKAVVARLQNSSFENKKIVDFVYDVDMTLAGVTTRLLDGKIKISLAV